MLCKLPGVLFDQTDDVFGRYDFVARSGIFISLDLALLNFKVGGLGILPHVLNVVKTLLDLKLLTCMRADLFDLLLVLEQV